jgi:hypothetical protein
MVAAVKPILLGLLSVLLLSSSASARQSGPRTVGAATMGAGILEAGIGAEYAAKANAPFAGAPRTLWRVPSVSIRWGAAANVDFRFEWSGRLLAGYAGGGKGSDWGDPVVSTVITALGEEGARPALGLRTAVKLPSTSFLPYYLGSDQTDFFCSLLASRHWGGAELRLNLGLGIIGNPRELGSQDDIYSLSAALLVPAGEGLTLFGEAYGMSGYKEDDDKLLLRSGLSGAFGPWRVDLFGGVRAAGSTMDFGPAFTASEDWSAGITIAKRFTL